MSTFCHGIASCQALDKSGEIVEIKGLDITSLAKTGIVNYEHKSDVPGQICGKILTAKKIFTKQDCSNDNESYFWEKCKVPFVYITAELLDDYCQSGKDAAGLFRYDHDKKGPNYSAILGFSVEGSEIPNTRKGMVITRSIARKVTLTASPCNAQCVAELLIESPKTQVKEDFDFLFKTTQQAISLFKSGEGSKIYEQYLAKKEDVPASVKNPYNEYENKGIRAGTNKAGQHVFSHGTVGAYKFNPAEHQHSGEHHNHPITVAQNPKLGDNKAQRAVAHSVATAAGGRVENRAALSLDDKSKISTQVSKNPVIKSEDAPYPLPVSSKAPKTFGQKASDKGVKIGSTTSGKDVHSHAKVGEYGFNSKEHKEAGELHRKAAVSAPNAKLADTHIEKMKLHNQAALTSGKNENRLVPGQAVKRKAMIAESKKQSLGKTECTHKKLQKDQFGYPDSPTPSASMSAPPPEPNKANAASMNQTTSGDPLVGAIGGMFGKKEKKGKEIKKAIEAGSYNAAPSTLTNGAAYQKESMGSRQATTGAEDHNFVGTKKKDWKRQADEDYKNWPNREKFEKFMQARMPHLKMGEIVAIGKTLALKKSIDFEKSLGALVALKKKS